MKKFAEVNDPRHKSYIDYSGKEMLGTLYYKGIAGISSMRGMTTEFNRETVCNNLYSVMESEKRSNLK